MAFYKEIRFYLNSVHALSVFLFILGNTAEIRFDFLALAAIHSTQSLVIGILLQVVKQVDSGGCFGFHVGVAALVPIELIAAEVSLRGQVQRLSPESVRLAVRESEDVLLPSDPVER